MRSKYLKISVSLHFALILTFPALQHLLIKKIKSTVYLTNLKIKCE